jgi:diketogulonate reductase-like aldo/keto reductase
MSSDDHRIIRFYGNEKEVGEAVRQSGLKRSGVFIATKSGPVLGAWRGHTRGSHNELSIPIRLIDFLIDI